MRARLGPMIVLTTAALAGGAPALAQSPPCIPSGVGAAPYTGDWTHLPRDQRIALCKEGERREQERQKQAQQQAPEASPPATTPRPAATAPPEPTTGDTQAATAGDRMERPILRGTDASGVPLLTDDPNLLRR